MSSTLATSGHLGPYRLEGVLGTGATGVVFRATDERLGRRVALKVLVAASGAGHEQDRDRLRQEASLASQVVHPTVVTIFAREDIAGHAVIAMELVEGETLAARLARGERWPPAAAAALLTEVSAGVAAAHALGVLHRDLAPANVMLSPDGRVKVLDFGIAAAARSIGRDGRAPGTAAYVAPELMRGAVPTAAADVWSLGVLFAELVQGEPPFGRGAASDVAMAVSARAATVLAPGGELARACGPWWPVIRASLDPDPAVRPPTAGVFGQALVGVAGRRSGDLPPMVAAGVRRRTPREQQLRLAWAALVLLTVSSMALLWWWW